MVLLNEPFGRIFLLSMDMKISDPDTLEDAPYKTDIRFFYTERGIYFGIVNHQPAETVVSRLARMTTPFFYFERSIRVYNRCLPARVDMVMALA